MAPFGESTLSWTAGVGVIDLDTPVYIGPDGRASLTPPDGRPVIGEGHPKDGLLTLTLRNRSEWEIHEVTVSISVPPQPRRTYRLLALPNADDTFTRVVPDPPPPGATPTTRAADSNQVTAWTWSFERIRGIPP